ncbi:MAG: hypothetical protein DMD95_23195 [Candidatus Rokuibacteriota bacterium]|nr:MAG: hypothetical protein DMD95_23195 [Candidatus Rokubacteria bacterium]
MNRSSLFVLLLATGVALADDAPKAKGAGPATEAQEKTKEEAQAATKEDPNLGMSILGNQEAPKALVIVPWKRSEIGNALGISTMLDDSRLPVDKEVFMRMLSYYEIRSETARHGSAPVTGRDAAPTEKSEPAQPTTAAHRRKS